VNSVAEEGQGLDTAGELAAKDPPIGVAACLTALIIRGAQIRSICY
jgi:hypothetical protein